MQARLGLIGLFLMLPGCLQTPSDRDCIAGASVEYLGWANTDADENWTLSVVSTVEEESVLAVGGKSVDTCRASYWEMQEAGDGIQYFEINATRWYRLADGQLMHAAWVVTGHNATGPVRSEYESWSECSTSGDSRRRVGAVQTETCLNTEFDRMRGEWSNSSSYSTSKVVGREVIRVPAGEFRTWHSEDMTDSEDVERRSATQTWSAEIACVGDVSVKTVWPNAQLALVAVHCPAK